MRYYIKVESFYMNRLLFILLEQINHEPYDSVDFIIALYILKNMQYIKKISIQELANATMVSKSTISRFCRKIGYEDYNELMYDLNRGSDRWGDYSQHPLIQGDYRKYLKTIAEIALELDKTVDYDSIKDIVEDMYSYTNIYLMGSMQAYTPALTLQEELCASGKVTLAPAIFSLQTEAILRAEESDLFIVFSKSGKFFDRIFINHSNRDVLKKPKIWLITANPNLKESSVYNRILYIPQNERFEEHPLKFIMVANMIALAYAEHVKEISENESFVS